MFLRRLASESVRICLKNRHEIVRKRPDCGEIGRFRTDGRPDSASESVRKRPNPSGKTSIYASVRPGYPYRVTGSGR